MRPSSTIRPCSSTSTRSAISTVDKPVGDDQRRAVGQHRLQRVLHHPLAGDVQRRRRLVEDQHGGVGQERPGERHQLALAGRQPTAALGDIGVVAVGQRLDERVRTDGRGRGADLVVGGVGSAEPDVVGDGAVEHEVLLRHHHHMAAQIVLRQVTQVDAVEGHRTRRSGRRTGRSAWRSWSCPRRWCRPGRRSGRPAPCRFRPGSTGATGRRSRTRRRRTTRHRAPVGKRDGIGGIGDRRRRCAAHPPASPAPRTPTGRC